MVVLVDLTQANRSLETCSRVHRVGRGDGVGDQVSEREDFQRHVQCVEKTIEYQQIIETIKMLDEQKFGRATVTMGISLYECIDSDGGRGVRYMTIVCRERKLEVADRIGGQYAIPIVNKRIAVTPISFVAAAGGEEDYVAFAKTLDECAMQTGVDFVGGFSALVHKGMTESDRILIDSIPAALAETQRVCASVNVGTTKTGINMDAVKRLGEVIVETAQATAR